MFGFYRAGPVGPGGVVTMTTTPRPEDEVKVDVAELLDDDNYIFPVRLNAQGEVRELWCI